MNMKNILTLIALGTLSVSQATAEPLKVVLEPGEEKEVTQRLSLKKPKLWSCEKPYLYHLKTTLKAEDSEIDSHKTTFGVRTVEWRADGFYLNNERVQIKGVCEHHDLGALGAAFHTRAYERKIEILKNMGCNTIRMTHNPPAPEVLDLCDKHGILVIDELFDIWESRKYDKINRPYTNAVPIFLIDAGADMRYHGGMAVLYCLYPLTHY